MTARDTSAKLRAKGKKANREPKAVPSLSEILKNVTCVTDLDNALKQPLVRECYPEVYAQHSLSIATKNVLCELIDNEGQSYIAAPLVSKLMSESEVTPSELTKLVAQDKVCEDKGQLKKDIKKKIKNMRDRGADKWKEVLDMARAPRKKSKLAVIPSEERRLIREWVKSRCELDSGTNIWKCNLTKQKLYELYILVGAPTVYHSMLNFPEFQRRANSFKSDKTKKEDAPGKRTDDSLKQEKTTRRMRASLAKSLYFTRQWFRNGLHTKRPQGIWARDERTFWRVLKQRVNRKQILRLCFSKKVHPCPLCSKYYELKALYDDTCASLLVAEESSKASLEARKTPLLTQIQALKDHVDKYKHQRKELQDLEAKLHLYPGLAIVYEDFCSRYQADGTKM